MKNPSSWERFMVNKRERERQKMMSFLLMRNHSLWSTANIVSSKIHEGRKIEDALWTRQHYEDRFQVKEGVFWRTSRMQRSVHPFGMRHLLRDIVTMTWLPPSPGTDPTSKRHRNDDLMRIWHTCDVQPVDRASVAPIHFPPRKGRLDQGCFRINNLASGVHTTGGTSSLGAIAHADG